MSTQGTIFPTMISVRASGVTMSCSSVPISRSRTMPSDVRTARSLLCAIASSAILKPWAACCIIAAGFSSGSIFGEIGSAREAVLSVSYNIVFLLAIVSIAASQHTFSLGALAQQSASPLRWLGVIAILVCLPAKLHLNPFSLPNAEQEIYSGPITEYAGPELAMWELSHGLEWVAATGLVATLAAPVVATWWAAALIFVALCFGIVLLLSVVAAATARLQIDTTVRFYWRCTLIFAVLAVASALFMRFRA